MLLGVTSQSLMPMFSFTQTNFETQPEISESRSIGLLALSSHFHVLRLMLSRELISLTRMGFIYLVTFSENISSLKMLELLLQNLSIFPHFFSPELTPPKLLSLSPTCAAVSSGESPHHSDSL